MTKKDDAISGVVFRYQNPYNFYSMEMYEKVLSIKKMKDGKMEELSSIEMPDFAAGSWYDMQLEIVKGSFKVRMELCTTIDHPHQSEDFDGLEIVLTAEDNEFS